MNELCHVMVQYFWGCRWGELESGQTTIAFTPLHQHETDDLTGAVQTAAWSSGKRQPVEVCFAYPDVDAAYKVRIYLYIYVYSPNQFQY